MIIHICYIFFEDMLVLFVSLWPLFMHGSGNYLLLCAFLDVKFTKMHPWGLSCNLVENFNFKQISEYLFVIQLMHVSGASFSLPGLH
jgi:hypothetical protein